MYIGDSISCGKRTALNAISDGEILFDGFVPLSLAARYFLRSRLSITSQNVYTGSLISIIV